MTEIILNNFKEAFNVILYQFNIKDYYYKLISNCLYLHVYIKTYNYPVYIKITTQSLYSLNSLYLALYQVFIQYFYQSFVNFNYLSYAYNKQTNTLYCIIDFDDNNRDRKFDNCLIIKDDIRLITFNSPFIVGKMKIHNNNKYGCIEWNDNFDIEFEKDFKQ